VKTIRVAFGGFLLATALASVCALGFLGGAGCSSPEKEGAEGAQCNVFTDCAGGLFCVQMICTSDAAALVMIEDAGTPMQAEAAAAPPEGDGSGVDMADGSVGTGAPPAGDASAGPDVSTMPAEAGPAPADDAAPVEAAAPPPPDDAGDEP
jgi:hypothetical protein